MVVVGNVWIEALSSMVQLDLADRSYVRSLTKAGLQHVDGVCEIAMSIRVEDPYGRETVLRWRPAQEARRVPIGLAIIDCMLAGWLSAPA